MYTVPFRLSHKDRPTLADAIGLLPVNVTVGDAIAHMMPTVDTGGPRGAIPVFLPQSSFSQFRLLIYIVFRYICLSIEIFSRNHDVFPKKSAPPL